MGIKGGGGVPPPRNSNHSTYLGRMGGVEESPPPLISWLVVLGALRRVISESLFGPPVANTCHSELWII